MNLTLANFEVGTKFLLIACVSKKYHGGLQKSQQIKHVWVGDFAFQTAKIGIFILSCPNAIMSNTKGRDTVLSDPITNTSDHIDVMFNRIKTVKVRDLLASTLTKMMKWSGNIHAIHYYFNDKSDGL